MRLRRLYLLAGLIIAFATRSLAAEPDWSVVSVAKVKTGIYVGSVTLIASDFRRDGEVYRATYEAKVWPWFFWNETGRISIHFSPADLEKLSRGERVEFTGEAFNQKNKPRKISGHVDRGDATSGKIKVRIAVDDTALIFNSTYRFPNASH